MRQLGCAILCLALILCLSGCACKHEWAEATCMEPKTCTKCGETEGDPLEHTPGEWVQDEPDYVTGLVWLRQYCSVCGKELDTDLKSLTSFHNADTFLFTPQQFVDRLNSIFSVLTKNYSFFGSYSAQLFSPDSTSLGCVITDSLGDLICTVLFQDKNAETILEENSHLMNAIMSGFSTKDPDEVTNVLLALALVVNPDLEVSDANALCQKVLNDTYTCDGLRYVFTSYGEKYYFRISIV